MIENTRLNLERELIVAKRMVKTDDSPSIRAYVAELEKRIKAFQK